MCGRQNTDLLDAFSNTDKPYGDCMLSMSALINKQYIIIN